MASPAPLWLAMGGPGHLPPGTGGLAALHSHGTATAKEVVLALFPLTHPLALLNDLVRWRRKAWLPPACYILAWILWSWGGFRAHQHEFERMHRILAQLKYEAQPIRATDLARVSVDPERNRWDHPLPSASCRGGKPRRRRTQNPGGH